MAGILMSSRIALAAAAALCAAAASASAATWPTHAIRVTVPYAAGGTVDTVARFLAPKPGAEPGQPPVAVENKLGPGREGKATLPDVPCLAGLVGWSKIEKIHG